MKTTVCRVRIWYKNKLLNAQLSNKVVTANTVWRFMDPEEFVQPPNHPLCFIAINELLTENKLSWLIYQTAIVVVLIILMFAAFL